MTKPTTTSLVIKPHVDIVLSARRETDVRTALTRGIKEYIETLSIDADVGGRQRSFRKVEHTWAEPEVPAEYPSACVYAESPGEYDASSLTPETKDLGDGLVLRKISEYKQSIIVEYYATDPAERMLFTMMLEDAFDPVDWMTGFLLKLPHYHGAHATFLKESLVYVDNQDAARRRSRVGRIHLEAVCPQFRFVGIVPKAKFWLDLGEREGGHGGVGPDVVFETV